MTNITQKHRAAFEALTSEEYRNFALFSGFVDGQPTAAIVAVNRAGDEYRVTPLFIVPTADMVLTDHDGTVAGQLDLFA